MSNKHRIFALQLKKMASKYPSYNTIDGINFCTTTLKERLLYIASQEVDAQSTIDYIHSTISMNDLDTVDNMIYDLRLTMPQKLSLKSIYDYLFTVLNNGNEASIKLSDLKYVGYFDTSDISDPVSVGI